MDIQPKIVIIDDEEVVLDSCNMILAGGKYQVSSAPDGARGLELVKEVNPDLVLVDLKMPGMPGLEVLQHIRDFDPTIITVVITGFATIDSAVDAMKNGAYDFLPKPFTPDEFRMVIRRGLERRKLVQEAILLRREKDMLRENFAAIVSHEIKSPLGAVQQNLYVLSEELASSLSETQMARLERMKVRIDDLLKLINSWLRVYSVDINKITESFTPLSVASVVAKAIETIQPHALRKDLNLVTSIDESLPPFYGEEVSFIETLVNILCNAVKYSYFRGTISVHASLSGEMIQISITDEGVGIPAEELSSVLSDFYRGTGENSGEGSHGLGLTISRRIIEAHKGKISVDSEFGKGTTFTVSVPALVIKESAQ